MHSQHNFMENGQLDVIIGTMFSGKTSYILSKIAKLAELNYQILYINIEFDTRSENVFSTHNPFFDTHVDFIKKESIKNNVSMIKSKNLVGIDILKYDVIIVDESHFFDDLLDFVNDCLSMNKYIIVSGLMADFKGNKFGKTLDLIPICTNIERLHAYCAECAKDKKCSIAIYSKKIVKCKKSIDIGGSEKYIPVCRNHYIEQTKQTNIDLNEENSKSKILKPKKNNDNKFQLETELGQTQTIKNDKIIIEHNDDNNTEKYENKI